MPRNNERYSGLWTGLTAGTRRCCLRVMRTENACGLRAWAPERTIEVVRDCRAGRGRSGDAVWTRACFGSTRQRDMSGPAARACASRRSTIGPKRSACPGTRRRRRHCRGSSRSGPPCPAHRRSVRSRRASYCPASAAINDSGKPSRRNSARVQALCTSRPVMQTPQALLTVSTMLLVLPWERDRGTDRSRAGARDSPRRACFRAPGLAARRRSPCAAGPRAPRPGSRQRRNGIARP